MTNYLLAGGGTAGHVNPLLALAEYIRKHEPDAKIICLGTSEGLEAKLVPQRGFALSVVERLPFPRRLNGYALSFPMRFARSVKVVERLMRTEKIDVVVGFGGYASAPAYEAARKVRTPIVIHEANALPGMANRRGSKFASATGVAFRQALSLNRSVFVGMPLRPEVEALDIANVRSAARSHFGLEPNTATLLVTGGSLGAKRINETIEASRTLLKAAGIQVLHIMGDRSDLPAIDEPGYKRIAYCDRMDLAIASADIAIARSGAATVSEFAALGLPAIYVPYPVGNGEQALNAKDVCEAGGGRVVLDKDFDAAFVASEVIPLVSDHRQLKEMASKAASVGVLDGTKRLFELVAGVLKG